MTDQWREYIRGDYQVCEHGRLTFCDTCDASGLCPNGHVLGWDGSADYCEACESVDVTECCGVAFRSPCKTWCVNADGNEERARALLLRFDARAALPGGRDIS